MKRSIDMKNYLMKGLLLGTFALAAGNAGAVDYYLAAKAYDKTMPDGSTVPMWGYVLDSGGACYDAADDAARLACVNALTAVPTSPGPELIVPPTDDSLRVFLSNGLPEATSIIITGQELPYSATNNGPTFVRPNGNAYVGNRGDAPPGFAAQLRVRSFGREAGANGGRQDYVWNDNRSTNFLKTGTFIYYSGTWPQKQVYMGLYGAAMKDAGAGEVYSGVAYADQEVLFYSDIDPEQNAAVAAAAADPNAEFDTAIHYHARWFLINGEPYSADCTDSAPIDGADDASGYPCLNMAETLDIPVANAGSATLLRFLSTASETHVPVLQGMHMTIHAEDGIRYEWQNGDVFGGYAPREQYSIMLPPLKTKDVTITPNLGGRYALYDGNGYMTNPTDPEDIDHADPVGGMLRFLSVGAGAANQPPVLGDDNVTVVAGRDAIIDVLANDSDPEGQALFIDSNTVIAVGNPDCVTSGIHCELTGLAVGIYNFTYTVTDGDNHMQGPATVNVSVVPNDPPIAGIDAATTDAGVPVTIDVLANDSDPNGDALSVAITVPPLVGTADVNPDNTITYTPAGDGVHSFTYAATDIDGASDDATVSVTVIGAPTNTVPVATPDSYTIGEAGVLYGNVITDDTGNGADSDADGDPLTAVLDSGPTPDFAEFALNPDGSFMYRSTPEFDGQVTFTYHVVDDDANASATVVVTITVTPVNDIPVANADTFYLNSMETTDIAAPGVLGNDVDADGDNLTVQNVVPSAGTVDMNANTGAFGYTPQGGIANQTVGTVATFTYTANDGIADSDPATVSINRLLIVRQAVCEIAGNRCDWVIEGNVNTVPELDENQNPIAGTWIPDGSTVEVRRRNANGAVLGTGTVTGGAWTVDVPNSRYRGARIYVHVQGNSNAVIEGYPTVRQ